MTGHPIHDTARDTTWQEQAACVDRSPEDFYPITYVSNGHLTVHVREVLAFCRNECPVRDACRDDAIATEDYWGIRGGHTPDELRILAARRRKPRTRDPLPPIDHGTMTGWRQHGMRHIPACEKCRAAHEADRIARARARLATRHGTVAGYQTHRRALGEEACPACKEAVRLASARVRAEREASA